jgi:hypothetical protein
MHGADYTKNYTNRNPMDPKSTQKFVIFESYEIRTHADGRKSLWWQEPHGECVMQGWLPSVRVLGVVRPEPSACHSQ